MFTTKTKTLNFKLFVLRICISMILGIPWMLLSFIFPIFEFGPIRFDNTFPEKCFEYGIWFTSAVTIFNIFYGFFVQMFLRKKFVSESLEIIHSAVLPKDLPKVVYVYTTHNDFMPGRLLQSMKQKYKNFEVWISDGSTKPEMRKEIELFAKNNSINLHQMPISGSKNKADNLNDFLKKSNAKFDYLLISDADEVINENFVNTSVRFFYGENSSNLAFVSSLNQTYKTKSAFSNVFRSLDNVSFFFFDAKRAYSMFDYPNLYSASCLISGRFLDTINNTFPEGCFEDFYTESIAAKNGWNGLINCLTVSLQAYDTTIKTNHSRLLRIFDWSLKYDKNNPFDKFNEKYLTWFYRMYLKMYIPLVVVVGVLGLIIAICAFIFNWEYFSSNKSLITSAIVTVATFTFSYLFLFLFQYMRVLSWKSVLFLLLLLPFWVLSFVPGTLKHWFNSMIRNKYSDFGGSPKRYFTRGFLNHLVKIKWDMLLMTFFGVAVGLVTWLFVSYNLIEQNKIIFICLEVILGLAFICWFSNVLLYLISLIPSNRSYNPNDFIIYNNKFVKSTKTIDSFYRKNNLDRLC